MNQVKDNVQPQPRASLTEFGGEKGIKNPLLMYFWNSAAIVFNTEPNPLRILCCGMDMKQARFFPIKGMDQGVGDEVH